MWTNRQVNIDTSRWFHIYLEPNRKAVRKTVGPSAKQKQTTKAGATRRTNEIATCMRKEKENQPLYEK